MQKHFPHYSTTLISNARRLRREMTKAEGKIWSRLRNNLLEVKVRRQVPFGKYILDFYCASIKICIELDGSQHYSEEGMLKDKARDAYLREQGIEILRFSDRDALANTDGVLQMIYEKVQEKLKQMTSSRPSPKRGRW